MRKANLSIDSNFLRQEEGQIPTSTADIQHSISFFNSVFSHINHQFCFPQLAQYNQFIY